MSSFATKLNILMLAALAAASPTWKPSPAPSPSQPQGFCPSGYKSITLSNQDCNFDSLNPGLSAVAVGEGAMIPYGYCGVYFQAFQVLRVVNTGLNSVTGLPIENGLVPHSGQQYASTSAQTQTAGGQPMITVNFPSSTTKNFDFNSLYFGCVVGAENTAEDLLVGCTMSIAGFVGDDNTVANSKLVCSDSVTYNPTTMLGAQQMAQHAVNSACKDLSFVTIEFTIDPEFTVDQGLTFAGLIDDVVITARECNSTSSSFV